MNLVTGGVIGGGMLLAGLLLSGVADAEQVSAVAAIAASGVAVVAYVRTRPDAPAERVADESQSEG